MRGNSGCVVERFGECPNIVLKHCNNIYPVDRLKAQVKKQQWFYYNCPLPCPKVLGTTKHGGYGFLIDYEESDDIFQYTTRKLLWFIDQINKYFEWAMDEVSWETVPAETFQKKMDYVRDRTGIYIPYTFSSMKMPIGWCHGDFTIENMLPNFPECLILIDFLDSFIESPWIDIVKFRQDTKHKWILRNGGTKEQHNILDGLDNLFHHLINEDKYIPLQILNLARILPYANDYEKSFLMKEIKCLIQT